jgi:ABC-2 type transport system permease protein
VTAATVLTILGLSTVLRAPPTIAGWESVHRPEEMSYALYIWLSLSHGYLQFLWVIAAVILGLGGLIREEAAGSSGFSLALPVTRRTHVLARAVVGVSESILLGFIPGLMVVVLSPFIGRSYPLSQALLFAGILVSAGLVFYALGFLLSHVFRGEYAAPAVALAGIAAFYLLTKIPRFEFLNVFDAMDGKEVLTGRTFYLGSQLPITQIAASLVAACILIAVSVKVTSARDF